MKYLFITLLFLSACVAPQNNYGFDVQCFDASGKNIVNYYAQSVERYSNGIYIDKKMYVMNAVCIIEENK